MSHPLRRLFPPQRLFVGILLVLPAILSVGCQGDSSVTSGTAASDSTTSDASARADTATAEAIAQKAVAGVGKQGQMLEKHSDAQKIISGPALALFRVKQKVVFEIQIPQALQTFKALEGRMPKDHDEFMTKIVDAYHLKLPELPEGSVYRYNVEKGELWVYPEDKAP